MLFDTALVIPSDLRLVRLRADKGSEFADLACCKCRLDAGIELRLAFPPTPRQTGANGWIGSTLTPIVRSLLADSCLPHFLREELMQIVVRLSSRFQHAVKNNDRPSRLTTA